MTNRNKNILLGVLVIGVVSMTIAFAALSTTLNISGTANVDAASWDVHFENWTAAYPEYGQISGVQNKAVQTTAASMTPSTKGTLISGLVVTLNQPGDIAKYKFDIVNDGTINAKLDTFTKSITIQNTSTVPEDITYTVVCGDEATKPASGAQTLVNASAPSSDDTLEAGNSRACELTVIYNEVNSSGSAGQAQTYTGTARTLSITANWVWVQGNASAQSGGNGGQGGNEPAVASWDTYYTPTQTSGAATLPANSVIWAQENTTSGDKEVCGIYTGGTVCLTNSTTGRSSEFDSSCTATDGSCTVTGYAAQKKSEMEAKGATTSAGADYINYRNGDDNYCSIYPSGSAMCCQNLPEVGTSICCSIGSDGTTTCW